MENETQKNNEVVGSGVVAQATPVSATPTTASAPFSKQAPAQMDFRDGRKKNMRKSGGREARVKPEFDQKIINIRRVTRVASGGRRFSFSVALVSGNRKGMVGVGIGKGGDTALAIDKAAKNAKKNMVTMRLTKTMSIPHTVETKYASARIMIMPAPGKGVVAGSSVRNVIELAGIKDVTAKIISPSKNKLNNARAAVQALSLLKPARDNQKERGEKTENPVVKK